MKRFILMALPAMLALSASAQKEEIKKTPPKLVKVEKAKEVKTPAKKGKVRGKTPPKVVMEKFVPPPPPPAVKEESVKPPPPPPAVKKKNTKQPPKVVVKKIEARKVND